MPLYIPTSYDFHPNNNDGLLPRTLDALGHITNKDQLSHPFLLSNRAWRAVDEPFGELVSKTIKHLEILNNTPIRVLDVGCGARARAADELQNHKKFGKHVLVTALDIACEVPSDSNVDQVCADMRQIPIADGSIDIAYSRQSFCYLADKSKHLAQEAISEVERVLKPGGVFFVDQHTQGYQDLDIQQSDFLHGHATYFSKSLSFALKQAYEWDYDSQFYMMVKKGGSGAVKTFLQNQTGVHNI